jgi:hypothetical protein
MKRKTLLLTIFAGAGLALVTAFHASAQFNPQPDPPAFGFVGINPGQTMRLIATCYAYLPAVQNGCGVEFSVQDLQGNTIQKVTKTIPLGKGDYLDVPAVQTPLELAGRREYLPIVKVSGRGVAVLPVVEVFDGTGKTQVYTNPAMPAARALIGLL